MPLSTASIGNAGDFFPKSIPHLHLINTEHSGFKELSQDITVSLHFQLVCLAFIYFSSHVAIDGTQISRNLREVRSHHCPLHWVKPLCCGKAKSVSTINDSCSEHRTKWTQTLELSLHTLDFTDEYETQCIPVVQVPQHFPKLLRTSGGLRMATPKWADFLSSLSKPRSVHRIKADICK